MAWHSNSRTAGQEIVYRMEIGMRDQRIVSEILIVSLPPIEDGMYQIGREFSVS